MFLAGSGMTGDISVITSDKFREMYFTERNTPRANMHYDKRVLGSCTDNPAQRLCRIARLFSNV